MHVLDASTITSAMFVWNITVKNDERPGHENVPDSVIQSIRSADCGRIRR